MPLLPTLLQYIIVYMQIKLKQYEKKVRKAIAHHEVNHTSAREVVMDAATMEKFVAAAAGEKRKHHNSKITVEESKLLGNKLTGTKRVSPAVVDALDDGSTDVKGTRKGRRARNKQERKDVALDFLQNTIAEVKMKR